MIYLVNMPFASIVHPNLALGTFEAQLGAAGLACRTHNFNLDFARQVGLGAYEVIARFKGVETQISEWLFTEQAWGRLLGVDEEAFLALCGEELTTIPHVVDVRAWLRLVRREVVPAFLRRCVDELAEDGPPRVVGFSCTFFQTLASLALARALRARFPDVKLVFGGACFHGEMGEELMAKIPWIDAVSTGEADDVVVPLMRAMLAGEAPGGLQGVLHRGPDGAVVTGAPRVPASAEVLDALPDPQFDEFFRRADALGLSRYASWRERVFLPFEASRGCWWGQKQHCNFCGLNAEGMSFRAKSSARVEASLRSLARRYPVHRMHATDNILAVAHGKELLPRLAEAPLEPHPAIDRPIELFFEVKANATRAQIAGLRAAAITCTQPGLESLSSHLLERMRKGVTALQNVFHLKCSREHGISVLWNILIRIPGERAEDYAAMTAWIPRLLHLQPPAGGAPMVECHRFSPYHADAPRFAHALRPMAWYRGLFPADFDLSRVAYYFDADWKDVLPEQAYDALRAAVTGWIERWRVGEAAPRLVAHEREDGGIEIEDTRGDGPRLHRLDPRRAAVYRAIADPARPGKIARELGDADRADVGEAELRAILDEFEAEGLALREGDTWLALALAPRAVEWSGEERRQRLRQVVGQGPRAEAGPRRLRVVV